MKRITAFIASIALSPIVWGEISPVYAQASCQATVDAVAREIRKKGTNLKIRVSHDGREWPTLDNSRRIGRISISLNAKQKSGRDSHVATNILYSEVLQKSYAVRIFDNCGGTGVLSIGEEGTDWTYHFGMTDSGQLLFMDQCLGDCRWVTPNF